MRRVNIISNLSLTLTQNPEASSLKSSAMPPPPVPLWLQKAYNQDHINNVWRILADRERSRIRARLLSACYNHLEPGLSPSPAEHLATAHLPSSANPRANITDHYSIVIGCSPGNGVRNRYSDIQPYDRTRVDAGGRYFNANWVRELAGGRWTIATQAPLPNTAHEFLSLIAGIHPPLGPHEEPNLKFTRFRTAVQLTQNFESGRQKAHPYFPDEPGESRIVLPPQETIGLPPLRVTLVKSEVIESAQCVASTVSVAPIVAGVPRSSVVFHHLLYGAWPDHGIPEPEDRAGLLNFIRLVDRTNKDLGGLEATADVEPPIMVNCSAGVGRTGSFIALCSLMRSHDLLSQHNSEPAERAPICPPPLPQSPLGLLPGSISWDEVGQEIDSLREQRPGMVQRPEQAVLVYEVLIAAFLTKDNVVHGHGHGYRS
ncbi:protein-tyrosine phosphatase-like protein [Lactifluus subvellereus]|nr:protein-tyrosine phosphatase-like protein [Lactifluus subvellereus]